MSEIEKLLRELKNMKEEAGNGPKNTKEVWAMLGAKDIEGAGFASEEEAAAWIEENAYANIS